MVWSSKLQEEREFVQERQSVSHCCHCYLRSTLETHKLTVKVCPDRGGVQSPGDPLWPLPELCGALEKTSERRGAAPERAGVGYNKAVDPRKEKHPLPADATS
jgi:hypothetical protein